MPQPCLPADVSSRIDAMSQIDRDVFAIWLLDRHCLRLVEDPHLSAMLGDGFAFISSRMNGDQPSLSQLADRWNDTIGWKRIKAWPDWQFQIYSALCWALAGEAVESAEFAVCGYELRQGDAATVVQSIRERVMR